MQLNLTLFAALLITVTAHATDLATNYLVRFKSSVNTQKAGELLAQTGFKTLKTLNPLNIYVVTEAADQKSNLDMLKSFPEVDYIEKETSAAVNSEENNPNDALFSSQTWVKRIHLPEAWKLSTGSYDVKVAVLDSGLSSEHPDLIHQHALGWNFSDNNADISDHEGHGTHVAGIIGAEGNNALGVAGVNWRVSLMPLKVCAKNKCSVTHAIEAILYAVKNGARVMNLSWGNQVYSRALNDAFDFAFAQGTIGVCSAGNKHQNNEAISHFPSSSPSAGILAVASSLKDGVLSKFSNWGMFSVDLSAPGSGILSTIPDGKWKKKNGTSMATPVVSGVAALILSLVPTLSGLDLRNAKMLFEFLDRAT